MTSAKDIVLKQIDSKTGNAFVKAHHYSGKVAQNSQLHLGVFLDERLHGVMQFGPSLDKRKIQGLVEGTEWHEFLELNRMAFDDVLPRNSESRALSVAFKLLKKHAPQVKWVVSFADGTQCGDGTIYRAAGFVLTGIKVNTQVLQMDSGEIIHAQNLKQITFGNTAAANPERDAPNFYKLTNGGVSISKYMKASGKHGEPLKGFQLRYIYFIDPAYRARLTVPELPYSEIQARGATMYKGIRGGGETDNAPASKQETEGSSPIPPLMKVNNG